MNNIQDKIEEIKKEFMEKFGEFPYFLEKHKGMHPFYGEVKEFAHEEIWNFFESKFTTEVAKASGLPNAKRISTGSWVTVRKMTDDEISNEPEQMYCDDETSIIYSESELEFRVTEKEIK